MAWKRNKWKWNPAWLYQPVAHWIIFERAMQWSAYTLLSRYQHLRKRTPTLAGIYAWCRLSQRSIIFLFHHTLTGLTKKPHRVQRWSFPSFSESCSSIWLKLSDTAFKIFVIQKCEAKLNLHETSLAPGGRLPFCCNDTWWLWTNGCSDITWT